VPNNIEVILGRHDERITDLEEFRTKHEDEHIRLMKTIERIQNRPSWGVTMAISGMASAIVYLVMLVVGGN